MLANKIYALFCSAPMPQARTEHIGGKCPVENASMPLWLVGTSWARVCQHWHGTVPFTLVQ